MLSGRKRLQWAKMKHPHLLRNAMLSMLLMLLFGLAGKPMLFLLSEAIDIADWTEARLAFLWAGVIFGLSATGMDAAICLLTFGVVSPEWGVLNVIFRLLYVVYRVIALLGQVIALLMVVVITMRIAQPAVAALIIALELGITIAGYQGARCMEAQLRAEGG